jgi:glucosaminylphosphatidylinositol acyltransferase
MLPEQYKIFHESFMKNNNGSTAFETFLYIVPSSFTLLNTVLLTSAIKICSTNFPIKFLIEFMTMCVTLVLYTTVLSDIIGQIVLTLLVITIPMACKQMQSKLHLTPFVQIPSINPDFITVGRSVISLITAVCILAVDFQCFPRKLAKTEKFGFGKLCYCIYSRKQFY